MANSCRAAIFCHPARRKSADTKRLKFGPTLADILIVLLQGIAGDLERYMNLLSARQKLVASNIANADTPGYHAQDIDFQEEFQQAAGLPPQAVEVADLKMKNDGNNVS